MELKMVSVCPVAGPRVPIGVGVWSAGGVYLVAGRGGC